MKTKNAFKACAVFLGVIFVLYGTKNVNQWRETRRFRGEETAAGYGGFGDFPGGGGKGLGVQAPTSQFFSPAAGGSGGGTF